MKRIELCLHRGDMENVAHLRRLVGQHGRHRLILDALRVLAKMPPDLVQAAFRAEAAEALGRAGDSIGGVGLCGHPLDVDCVTCESQGSAGEADAAVAS